MCREAYGVRPACRRCREESGDSQAGAPVLRSSAATEGGSSTHSKRFARFNCETTVLSLPISPLKKAPGEGTGPTTQADSRGIFVGRFPSHGEQDVLKRSAILFRGEI